MGGQREGQKEKERETRGQMEGNGKPFGRIKGGYMVGQHGRETGGGRRVARKQTEGRGGEGKCERGMPEDYGNFKGRGTGRWRTVKVRSW